jgi:hypothetical protein
MSDEFDLTEKWLLQQAPVCARYGCELLIPDLELNVGVSRSILDGKWFNNGEWPIYGERFLPTATTNGWYLWTGENDGSVDFYVSVHAIHLETWVSDAIPYLGLPAGWSFVIAPGHEDVWFTPENVVE